MEVNKFLLLSLTLVLVIGLVESFEFSEKELESESSLQSLYQRWQSHHNLELPPPGDRNKRYNSFKANAKLVHNNNKMNKSYKLALNRYADLTGEEFRSIYTGAKVGQYRLPPPKPNNRNLSSIDHHALPEYFDWRDQGMVPPAKNQGACGSCWAFATIAAVESTVAIKTGKLIPLSAQELVDCENKSGGCTGGHETYAMNYIQDNGLACEQAYPYEQKQGTCRAPADKAARITGHHNLPQGEEETFLKAVSCQPVIVSIAVEMPLHLYKEGIYDTPCTTPVCHCVVVTGWGVENGVKYWIVMNSWGEEWGDKGFVKIKRDTGVKEGICEINMWVTHPVMEGPVQSKQDL